MGSQFTVLAFLSLGLPLEDLLLESAFTQGPSFVGAPYFVRALCRGTCGTCLNPTLAV
jgi:hypothetical protein